ncbi:MAG: hypothetical protein QM725_03835 [Lacibacter sp.]
MKSFLQIHSGRIQLLVILMFCINSVIAQKISAPVASIKEKLNVPFGTIVKIKVEIVDGDTLRMKAYTRMFLFRVLSVGDKKLTTPAIIEFNDETGKFPNEMDGLYKYLYGKTSGSPSSKEEETMKKKYVGKVFEIIGYETGGFVGEPVDYYKYQPGKQDWSFHFKNCLIVIGLANKK